MTTKAERKARFIRELARFLIEHQSSKGLALALEGGWLEKPPGMGVNWSQEWLSLRRESGLFGHPSVEDAERQLTDFLS